MDATELTPFIQKSPPPRKYCKCVLQTLVLTILAATLICIIYYIGFVSESSNIKRTALIELTEITIDLHPKDIYYLETLDRSNSEWKSYHSKLIGENGYNTNDKSIVYTFTMHDYHYGSAYYKQYLHAHHEEEHEPIAVPAKTPRPTILRTPRPTTPIIIRTSRPTNSQTMRPTQLRTPIKPTIAKTNRPTQLFTARPTIPPRTLRPTREDTPRPTEAGKKTPHPTTDFSYSSRHVTYGGLKCYAKYSLNEKTNIEGYVFGCNTENDILVGCVGGSTHRVKPKRSGEKAVVGGCMANGESIYIRCCYPEDASIHMTGMVSEIQYQQNPNFPVYSVNSFCHTTELDGFAHSFEPNDNYYLVGCTGWTGTSHDFHSSSGNTSKTQTTKMIGTRIIQGKQCRAHRGDKKGLIAAPAIVVALAAAELECITVESEPARVPKNTVVNSAKEVPEYAAMAFCTIGYALMDCGGFVEGAMDKCDTPSVGADKVTAVLFHGTDLKCMPDKEQHCSANGNTDKIRAQARCCKIIHEEEEHHPTMSPTHEQHEGEQHGTSKSPTQWRKHHEE